MIIQIAYERLIEFYTSNNSNYSYDKHNKNEIRMTFMLKRWNRQTQTQKIKITLDICKCKIDSSPITNVKKIKTKILNHHIYI